jgi:hypothetical protein
VVFWYENIPIEKTHFGHKVQIDSEESIQIELLQGSLGNSRFAFVSIVPLTLFKKRFCIAMTDDSVA